MRDVGKERERERQRESERRGEGGGEWKRERRGVVVAIEWHTGGGISRGG